MCRISRVVVSRRTFRVTVPVGSIEKLLVGI